MLPNSYYCFVDAFFPLFWVPFRIDFSSLNIEFEKIEFEKIEYEKIDFLIKFYVNPLDYRNT